MFFDSIVSPMWLLITLLILFSLINFLTYLQQLLNSTSGSSADLLLLTALPLQIICHIFLMLCMCDNFTLYTWLCGRCTVELLDLTCLSTTQSLYLQQSRYRQSAVILQKLGFRLSHGGDYFGAILTYKHMLPSPG